MRPSHTRRLRRPFGGELPDGEARRTRGLPEPGPRRSRRLPKPTGLLAHRGPLSPLPLSRSDPREVRSLSQSPAPSTMFTANIRAQSADRVRARLLGTVRTMWRSEIRELAQQIGVWTKTVVRHLPVREECEKVVGHVIGQRSPVVRIGGRLPGV